MGRICMRIMRNTWVNGSTTCNTDKEKNPGQTVPATSAAISKVKSTAKANSSSGTAQTTKENSNQTTSMARASTSGQTKKSTKEAGSTTKCPAKENTGGPMVATLRVNIKMIKNMGSGSLSGPTGGFTREYGSLGSSMEEGTILIKKAKKEKGFGSVRRGCAGWMKEKMEKLRRRDCECGSFE